MPFQPVIYMQIMTVVHLHIYLSKEGVTTIIIIIILCTCGILWQQAHQWAWKVQHKQARSVTAWLMGEAQKAQKQLTEHTGTAPSENVELPSTI